MDDMSVSALIERGLRRRRAATWAADGPLIDERGRQASSATMFPLFVTPCRRGGGFQAGIRGHLLELADPSSGHDLAPTPDDLHTASIAADFAWFTQRFLRDRGLDDDLSVTAWPRTKEGQSTIECVEVAVTISTRATVALAALSSALERELVGKFAHERVQFDVGAE